MKKEEDGVGELMPTCGYAGVTETRWEDKGRVTLYRDLWREANTNDYCVQSFEADFHIT